MPGWIPIGFAMDNFDAIGQWRGDGDAGQAIDASGVLPVVTKFNGVAELKKALLRHPEQFVQTVAEKLLMYGISRNVQYYDQPAVRAIVRQAAATNYSFASIVLGVVKSAPFQMRKSQEELAKPGVTNSGAAIGSKEEIADDVSDQSGAAPPDVFAGMGATLALPFLDAMAPALSAKGAKFTPRLGFVYTPNGFIQDQWIPTTLGAGYELTPTLKPLAALRDNLLIVSNLAHLQANTFGDGVGDHPRASAVWLSGVHAWDRTQPGMEVKLGTTADQFAARVIGKDSQVPSMELVLEKPTAIACDTSDCFFVNTISWRNPTTPNPAEAHPRLVFERLFGDGGTTAQRLARMQQTGSILDSVLQEVNRLQGTLGPGDRTKLTEYLDSVREIEQRIQSTEKKGATSPLELPDRPVDIPETFEEHAKLMYDLMVLGYRADVTRVFTMIMARELSSRTYPNIGVPEQHHAVSHHRNDPALIAKKAKIDTYHISLLDIFWRSCKTRRMAMDRYWITA